MTSYGNEQVAVEAIKSGALDYVVKSPEAFADMPHTVTRALHEWKLLQERKRAEEALEFQNIILSTQQETSLDGILVVDENGEIISFNRRFVEIWGIPSDVAESKSDERVLQSVMDKLAVPGEFVGKLEHLNEARDETSRDEITLKDGRIFDRYSAPMLGAAGKYYGRVWYFRDITKRRQFEVALREEEEWFRSVFENASDGLFFLSESGEIISVNKSFAAMHGYSVAEILKMSLKDLDTPEGHRMFPERMRRILAGENLTFELAHRHKQGHWFPLEVTANLVTMGAKNTFWHLTATSPCAGRRRRRCRRRSAGTKRSRKSPRWASSGRMRRGKPPTSIPAGARSPDCQPRTRWAKDGCARCIRRTGAGFSRLA